MQASLSEPADKGKPEAVAAASEPAARRRGKQETEVQPQVKQVARETGLSAPHSAD